MLMYHRHADRKKIHVVCVVAGTAFPCVDIVVLYYSIFLHIGLIEIPKSTRNTARDVFVHRVMYRPSRVPGSRVHFSYWNKGLRRA
jgi:hypothetical protein